MRRALVLSLALVGCDHDDGETVTYDVALPSGDPAVQFRADACRVDVDACRALCATVDRAGRGPSRPIGHCQVRFTSHGALVTVDATSFDVEE